jgi:hypothetical protein
MDVEQRLTEGLAQLGVPADSNLTGALVAHHRHRQPEGRGRQDHHRVNLAAALAATGRRVLLIDLGPAGQRDHGGGVDKREAHPSNCDHHVLLGEVAARAAIVTTPGKASTCCPATPT